jgi:FAD/FMN-containing dehydrogenase
MGLTGVILRLAFPLIRIETGFMRQDTLVCGSLDETLQAFREHQGATYSVAWTDCSASGDRLGRSLVYVAEHARRDELPSGLVEAPLRQGPRVPIEFPAINRLSVRAFNALHYGRGEPGRSYVGLQPYFYPLDALRDWHRLYGPSGFVQHQCVLPHDGAREGLRALIARIQKAGSGSFLVVLKLMGAGLVGRAGGPLSFPMAGYTLAIDFAANAANFSLLIELDAIVADHGGRLYLAKDARTGAASLRGYPDLDRFRQVREAIDPAHRFRSLQSERLGL